VSDLRPALTFAVNDELDAALDRIRHCLNQLTDEQVWWRPRAEMNSIGNMMLHLAGNLRQWIVSGIGGARDIRNRPEEFSDRSELPKNNIVAMLRAAVREADGLLEKLPTEKLTAPRRIQGFDTNVLAAIFDTVAHFRGHSQEIIHQTRQILGDKFKFDFVPQGPEQESAGAGRA
jgi:hypothetical protein